MGFCLLLICIMGVSFFYHYCPGSSLLDSLHHWLRYRLSRGDTTAYVSLVLTTNQRPRLTTDWYTAKSSYLVSLHLANFFFIHKPVYFHTHTRTHRTTAAGLSLAEPHPLSACPSSLLLSVLPLLLFLYIPVSFTSWSKTPCDVQSFHPGSSVKPVAFKDCREEEPLYFKHGKISKVKESVPY